MWSSFTDNAWSHVVNQCLRLAVFYTFANWWSVKMTSKYEQRVYYSSQPRIECTVFALSWETEILDFIRVVRRTLTDQSIVRRRLQNVRQLISAPYWIRHSRWNGPFTADIRPIAFTWAAYHVLVHLLLFFYYALILIMRRFNYSTTRKLLLVHSCV